MWVPAWDAVQALPGDGASKSQVFPDWGDVQLCSCTLCCKMQFSQRCTALELSAPVQCRVECTSAMQCIFGRLGTECILSHPMHPTASIRHCASAMYHNSMQCFATFCNICKILQRFVTYRNAEDSMQPRSSSANVQKAGYSSLSWSNTKYKDININFKTKQGRYENPIS